MAQPIDFVGLNTFIYEVAGWFPPEQDPVVDDNLTFSKAETSTNGGPTSNLNVPVHQNHKGCQISVNHEHLGFFKNHLFPLQLPDATTGLEPSTDAGKTRATASLFPALMLYRNGPYGWPTWKQIRIGSTHLIRKQRSNSIFTYVEEPGIEKQYSSSFGILTVPQAFSDIKVYRESSVVSNYKPVVVLGKTPIYFVEIRSTLGNETVYFDNFQPNRYFGLFKEQSDFYKNTKRLYLSGALQSQNSSLYSFYKLMYRESVYPANQNSYLNRTRFRVNFDFPWRHDIRARMRPGTSQTNDEYYAQQFLPNIGNGFGFNVYYVNRWPLDSAWNFDSFSPTEDGKYLIDGSTGQGAKSFDDYLRIQDTRKSIDSSSVFFPPVGGQRSFGENLEAPYSRRQNTINDSAGGDGQLMNTYCYFADWRQVSNSSGYANSIDDFLSASALYSRRHVIPSYKSVTHFASLGHPETSSYELDDILLPVEQNFGGSTKWQTPTTRRVRVFNSATDAFDDTLYEERKPFENSYSDFSYDTRIIGKDYSLVPEYRMSNHVEKFLRSTQVDRNDFGIFEITGGPLDNTNSISQDFYKIYTNSDFLKHFELVKKDHEGFVEPNSISLKCKALKKLLPYDGFYPQQRSLQLAKQFYKSYGDHFFNIEAYVEESDDPSDLQAIPSKVLIGVNGFHIDQYYENDLSEFYGGEPTLKGSSSSYASSRWEDRGDRAPIGNFSEEVYSFTGITKYGGIRATFLRIGCEYKSPHWDDQNKHPGKNAQDMAGDNIGIWTSDDSQHYYQFVENPNVQSGKLFQKHSGFIIQDANQQAIFIHLVDRRIWDQLRDNDFYGGTKRDYMFPVTAHGDNIAQVASANIQPLLIVIPSNGRWSKKWNSTLKAKHCSSHC